jgi:hypothetical protein
MKLTWTENANGLHEARHGVNEVSLGRYAGALVEEGGKLVNGYYRRSFWSYCVGNGDEDYVLAEGFLAGFFTAAQAQAAVEALCDRLPDDFPRELRDEQSMTPGQVKELLDRRMAE